eukprot:m.286394 g.286394  ORF g.286394 m.286394 type:complete len:445 (+) comp19929_c0_seq3:262-1596(+)
MAKKKGGAKAPTAPKAKPVADKTFGMKNKKGGKAQKQIEVLQRNVNAASDARREQQRKLREQQERDRKMLGNLFTPVEDKKKKKKEKTQEEVNSEKRKVEKKSLYEDDRDAKKEDTMDGWDQTKLEDVINQKHGKEKAAIAKTTIICKHFVKAVENGKYGWFWDCPGGAKCMYRHALPQGYVLKRDLEKEDEEEKISMEQLIEEERQNLLKNLPPGTQLTKVCEESFKKWKRNKILEKKLALRKEEKAKKKQIASGNAKGVSGRDMFTMGNAGLGEDAAGDDDGGDFDIASMLAQRNHDEMAAMAAAAEDGGGDGSGGRPDPTPDANGKPLVIDDALFNMDLGDLDLDALDEAALQELESASKKAAKAAKKSQAAAKKSAELALAAKQKEKKEKEAKEQAEKAAAAEANAVSEATGGDAPAVVVDEDLFANADLGDLDESALDG